MVAALGKSRTQGYRRLGKTKTWDTMILWMWKHVTVGLKVFCACICMPNMIDSEADGKKQRKMVSSPLFNTLLRRGNYFLMSPTSIFVKVKTWPSACRSDYRSHLFLLCHVGAGLKSCRGESRVLLQGKTQQRWREPIKRAFFGRVLVAHTKKVSRNNADETLWLGAGLSEIKPWALSSHQAIPEAAPPGNDSSKWFNPGHEHLPAVYRVQWLLGEKNISFHFKVVLVLLSVCQSLLLVTHWSVWWGQIIWLKIKGFISDICGLTWRDTFWELSSAKFLDLCKGILKKHVIYHRHCPSSHSRFLYLEILCNAFLSGGMYLLLKRIQFFWLSHQVVGLATWVNSLFKHLK